MGVLYDFARWEGAETVVWEGSHRVKEFRKLMLFSECPAVPLCAAGVSEKVIIFIILRIWEMSFDKKVDTLTP